LDDRHNAEGVLMTNGRSRREEEAEYGRRARWGIGRLSSPLLAGLVLIGAGCSSEDERGQTAPESLGSTQQSVISNPRKIAYYPIWSSTGDDLTVTYPEPPASIPWTKITHINLSFLGINKTTHKCSFVGVDGSTADSASLSNARALIKYRNVNAPGVKVMLSVGGWTMSQGFSEAMSSANRTAFVTSCANFLDPNKTSAQGNELDDGSSPRLFADGIDFDWEYPTSLGAGNCWSGHSCQSSSDPANYTATLSQFRSEFSTRGLTGRLLSAALHANTAGGGGVGNIPYEYQNFFTGSPARFDFVNIMSYDFYGGWDPTVNYTGPYDKTTQAMDYVVKGPNGVDDTTDGVGSGNKDKIILGIPFYGPAWKNVATPGTSGVGNAGTTISDESNISFGKALANFVNKYPTTCKVKTPTSGNTQNRYVYCAGTVSACIFPSSGGNCTNQNLTNLWISYDDASVVAAKSQWVADNNYGGVMWWSQGEDSSANDLVTSINSVLGGGGGGGTQAPYGGTAWAVPGTIEAEKYDTGGEGVAYHDTTTGNAGNTSCTSPARTDGVDLQATGGTDPGSCNIGWAAAGEWTEYTVNVTSTAAYTVSVRAATSATGKTLHVEMDGTTLGGTLAVPAGADYQTYSTISVAAGTLTAGQHTVKLVFDTGSVNVNWIQFSSSCTPTTCAAQGKDCGSISDGCGGTLSCGSCSSPETCGGGSVANVCGCTPTATCGGMNCGSIPDGCGGSISCGTCTSPATCGGSGTANVCGTDTTAPSAPSNLAAGSVTSSSVALSWTASTDNVGVTGYKIFNGGNQIGTSTSTSFTATGLAAASDYTFSVSADDAAGNNSGLTSVNATTAWASQDVGAVGAAGSFSKAGGTFTVNGAGSDTYGTADEFRYAYQSLTGDGTIVAHVASIANVGSTWSKAGVMMRDGTGAGAANVFMLASPTTTNNYRLQVRSTSGGSTTSTAAGTGCGTGAAPVWVKIVRSANSFTASCSADGASWTQVGTAQTVSMAQTIQVGLAVTSHVDATVAAGTFDNVSVTTGGVSCTPETDAEFCSRLAKNCGSVTGTDNCGASRTASCGSCTSPETCGGAGVANVCGNSVKIGALTVYDTANASYWGIMTNFQIGSSTADVWLDYPNTYVTSIDSGAPLLLGKEWVRTKAASKSYNGTNPAAEAKITLSSSSTVYLIVDDRVLALNHPDMTGWTDTTYALHVWESTTKPDLLLSIFKKLNQTGDVYLPIQNCNSGYNYFVIVE
jgi:GH18 family chitinase